MMSELKSCPFCGGRAVYIEGHVDHVSCTACDATGPNALIVGGMNKFDEAWNTRTKSDELDHLMNKINRVTSCHRHGRAVSEKDLTALSNAQVEYEQAK